MPQASGLAAELKDGLSIDPKLIPGGGGVFEVKVNGKLVFSKKSLKRCPESGEVLGLIRTG